LYVDNHHGTHAVCSTLGACLFSCHQRLSQVPNKLFYDGVLLNGTNPAQRFPFLTPLPGAVNRSSFGALQFINVPNGIEQGAQNGRGSLRNVEEAKAIASIVQILLIHGVKPSQLGVIAPFRSQVALIASHLASIQVEPRCRQPVEKWAVTQGQQRKGKKQALVKPPPSQSPQVSGSSVQVATVDSFQVSSLLRRIL
jgi:superfamily I DNA and/or RNA helicase